MPPFKLALNDEHICSLFRSSCLYLVIVCILSLKHVITFVVGGNSLSVFWRRVMVGPPSVEDLKVIVKASYPSLEPIVEKLIGLLYFLYIYMVQIKTHVPFD